MPQKCRKVIILIFILANLIFIPLVSTPMMRRGSIQESSDSFNNLNFSGSEINITTPKNVTYTKPMSGYYPATYGFENDEDGISQPDGFNNIYSPSCSGTVLSDIDGHKKMFRAYDNNAGGSAIVQQAFNDVGFQNQTYGSIEYWYRVSSISVNTETRLNYNYGKDEAAIVFRVYGSTGQWQQIDGTWVTIPNIPNPLPNIWHHMKIHFRCEGAPSYLGLSENQFELIVNGISSGALSFSATSSKIVMFMPIYTAWGIYGGNYAYCDAIAYSWDPSYNLGDNLNEGLLLSYENSTALEWKGYSLDNQANKTIRGNTTLPMPSPGHHTIQVFGNNSIGEMFESDVRHFSVRAIDIMTPENITYTKPMTGYYPATYGFENDEVDTIPMDWTDESYGPTWYKVIANEDGHNKVLQLYDTTSGDPYAIKAIGNKESGTVEFWMKNVNMNEKAYFTPRNGLTHLFRVLLADNLVKVTVQGGSGIDLVAAAADTWHHFSIDFECGIGSYKGLGQYQFYVTYNGVLYGPYNFWNNAPYAEDIAFSGFYGSGNYYYVDAIGYSWDPNYNVGDNLNEGLLLSYENSTVLDWTGYSLDKLANRTIRGNSTLPMPLEGHHTIQLFGNNSIGEIFESDIRYFTIKTLDIITPENITYTKPMSGYYPASYGFESDTIGGDALDWDDSLSDANCGSLVVAEKNGHYNVIEVYDNNGGSKARLDNYFTDQSYGTVELWISPEDATNGGVVRLLDDDLVENRVYLRLHSEHWYSYDGAVDTLIPNVPDPQDNVWQHVRIDFESTSGGYQGLSQYTYEVIIDGINSGPIPFYTNGGSIDRFNIFTSNTATTTRWIDAVGYSWDSGYTIGNNIYEGILLSYDKAFSTDWMGYSLDGQANQTILGNTTLLMPANGHHEIQVFGNNSIGEMFESDIRHFSVEYISINLLTPGNITYTEPMSGYYPATYGFEDEEDGTVPDGWDYRLTIPPADSYIKVISSLDGHNKVLDLNKGNTYGSHLIIGQNFSAQEYGTIEFWLRTTDVSEKTEIILRDENLSYCAISIAQSAASSFTIYASGEWQSLSYSASNNRWYHIKFQFECGTDNHYGLDQYYFRVFIDGVEFGDYNFDGTAIYLDRIAIVQTWDSDNYHSYFDAIGYSWNPNYNIGDNLNEGLLLSYENSTGLDWMGYSLDNQANKTIIGDIVIPMPDNGLHSIQVYGRSTLGYYYESNLVYFTVDVSEEPPPSPPNGENVYIILIFIFVGVFSLLGIAVAFIVYKKVHTPSIKPKPVKEPKPRKEKMKKVKTRKRRIIAEDLFCPFCHTTITPEQKFCTYCGSHLQEEREL
ncbi:MAG: zinc ribbon domain-containing protein [Promethearchaeota archaeon]